MGRFTGAARAEAEIWCEHCRPVPRMVRRVCFPFGVCDRPEFAFETFLTRDIVDQSLDVRTLYPFLCETAPWRSTV